MAKPILEKARESATVPDGNLKYVAWWSRNTRYVRNVASFVNATGFQLFCHELS